MDYVFAFASVSRWGESERARLREAGVVPTFEKDAAVELDGRTGVALRFDAKRPLPPDARLRTALGPGARLDSNVVRMPLVELNGLTL
jgi:hypothetical protein